MYSPCLQVRPQNRLRDALQDHSHVPRVRRRGHVVVDFLVGVAIPGEKLLDDVLQRRLNVAHAARVVCARGRGSRGYRCVSNLLSKCVIT